MTNKEIKELMEENSDLTFKGDNALEGLKIFAKYFPSNTVITGANHDIIYSVAVDDIAEAGITKEEVLRLRKELNWHIENSCFACFV